MGFQPPMTDFLDSTQGVSDMGRRGADAWLLGLHKLHNQFGIIFGPIMEDVSQVDFAGSQNSWPRTTSKEPFHGVWDLALVSFLPSGRVAIRWRMPENPLAIVANELRPCK